MSLFRRNRVTRPWSTWDARNLAEAINDRNNWYNLTPRDREVIQSELKHRGTSAYEQQKLREDEYLEGIHFIEPRPPLPPTDYDGS